MPNNKLVQLQEDCYNSLYTFACAVEPHREYAYCHQEMFEFWEKADVDDWYCTLILVPRGHQKSHCAAVRCVWEVYKNPAITIVYVSATTGLAERQLSDIQNIMESEHFRKLSPDMIKKDRGKRAMWNTMGISVDHPKRLEEGVRDPTVCVAGLTTNTCGWHCGMLFKDDVVVKENAYTKDARRKVEESCSQLASVLSVGGRECCVGTIYHPKDHYNTITEMMEEVIDEDTGDILDHKPVYRVHQRNVEKDGVFIWPRKKRNYDGALFGFNHKELSRIKAKYTDKLQFFANYYNNPNDLENRNIQRGHFRYYKIEHIKRKGNAWYYNERRLNVYAAMDFAFSKHKRADYSCIVVFGVDYEFNIYVLGIVRFRTNKTIEYFDNLKDMCLKWEFTKLRAEINAAQVVLVQSLKDMLVEEGLLCKIEDYRPNKYDGAKEERITAALIPKYEQGKVFHFKGGLCTYLEEEMLLDNPEHDDIKDTLAAGLSAPYIRKPIKTRLLTPDYTPLKYHSRFGGVL